jgi:predicted ribosomally synthesized peptide with nif11-like leader
MAITENVKKFMEAIEKDDALKAKIEALEGQDNAVEQAIAIAKEYGYTLTEEDLNALTDEDFAEDADEALSLDDLDSAAGGHVLGWFARELHYANRVGRKQF